MAQPPPGEAEDRLCPRCGAPFAEDQEYCLECGERLQRAPGVVGTLANAWRERFGWYPGDWVWPVLLALILAVAGAVVAVAVASSGRSAGTLIATRPGRATEPVAAPATATVALPTAPAGTPTAPGPPSTPTNPPPATTAPRQGGLTPWPTGRSAWTVVLESIPVSAGRSAAVARAQAAVSAGLSQVGVLASSRFSSLHPGYFVVFSGIYGSQSDANAAASAAAGKGFTAAYSREIVP